MVIYFIIITIVARHSYGLMDVAFIIIWGQLLTEILGIRSIDFIQCISFVTKFSNYDYEHGIIEQTSLLLMRIVYI